MKNFLFIILVLLSFSPVFSEANDASSLPKSKLELMLPNSTLEVDQGSFWIRKWSMSKPQGINIKTITNFDSALLMTFSGADFSYLNNQAASEVKQQGVSSYLWSWSDSNVDYKRTYQIQGDVAHVSVDIQFKQKAPEKAYLNLVSAGTKDDLEERDREVFYYTNGKIERNKVSESIDATEVSTPVKWIGAGSRYFVLTVVPEGAPAEKLLVQSTGPLNAQASLQFPVQSNQLHLKFKIALAPKDLEILRKIDPALDTTVDLGIFSFVAYPILWLLKYIYKFVHNYGIAIIILTIIIKILTFPLTLKSVKGMRKMSEFQPKMKALQDKHKGDKEALNKEMMAMMKGSGYNPMAGCFPMLVQMPIFFALYSVLYAAVELYHEPFYFWLTDLSAQDPYYITPVLMTIVMFFQQKLTPPAPGMDPTQQKVMQYMPLMFGVFMVTTPSGLCLYMLVNAITSILQQQYLNKKLGVPGNVSGVATTF